MFNFLSYVSVSNSLDILFIIVFILCLNIVRNIPPFLNGLRSIIWREIKLYRVDCNSLDYVLICSAASKKHNKMRNKSLAVNALLYIWPYTLLAWHRSFNKERRDSKLPLWLKWHIQRSVLRASKTLTISYKRVNSVLVKNGKA